jgi:hypothetical protein
MFSIYFDNYLLLKSDGDNFYFPDRQESFGHTIREFIGLPHKADLNESQEVWTFIIGCLMKLP